MLETTSSIDESHLPLGLLQLLVSSSSTDKLSHLILRHLELFVQAASMELRADDALFEAVVVLVSFVVVVSVNIVVGGMKESRLIKSIRSTIALTSSSKPSPLKSFCSEVCVEIEVCLRMMTSTESREDTIESESECQL